MGGACAWGAWDGLTCEWVGAPALMQTRTITGECLTVSEEMDETTALGRNIAEGDVPQLGKTAKAVSFSMYSSLFCLLPGSAIFNAAHLPSPCKIATKKSTCVRTSAGSGISGIPGQDCRHAADTAAIPTGNTTFAASSQAVEDTAMLPAWLWTRPHLEQPAFALSPPPTNCSPI